MNRTLTITGALGFVLLLGGAVAVAKDDLRFWGWRSDVVKIAQISYTTRLKQENDERRALRREIKECEKDEDCTDDDYWDLVKDRDEVLEEIDRLKIEQTEIQ